MSASAEALFLFLCVTIMKTFRRGGEITMSSVYLNNIRRAVLVFPFLAFLITIPFLIYNYRKYGSIPLMRWLAVYLFAFYLLTAYFLVILPLPPKEEVAHYTSARYNLHLFSYIEDFHAAGGVFDIRRPSTWLNLFSSSILLEPMFNVLLTVPFGVWLHWYQKRKFLPTMLAGFCLSLFFEVTQLTGLYFIYPRPYRLFDVNDLMTNTIGACLGWLISPILMKLFPSREEIDSQAVRGGRIVSYPRRLFAHLADTLILAIPCIPSAWLVRRYTSPEDPTMWITILYVLVSSLYLSFTHGKTIGMHLAGIRLIREADGKAPRFIQCLFRELLVRGVLLGGILIYFGNTIGQLSVSAADIYLFLLVLLWLFTIFNMIVHRFKGDRQVWFGRLSRTIYVTDLPECTM
jgi:glycopeptide antibiotics resistance protein